MAEDMKMIKMDIVNYMIRYKYSDKRWREIMEENARLKKYKYGQILKAIDKVRTMSKQRSKKTYKRKRK